MWQSGLTDSSDMDSVVELENEGEKEHQQEEKESNEAEDDLRDSGGDADDEEEEKDDAALDWQQGYTSDGLGLPIMQWEALSLRIAELEKQEEEKKEKRAHARPSLERGRAPVSRAEVRGRRAESWDDGEDAYISHVSALTSRLQTQMNLQLCFINNSESEEEKEETEEGPKVHSGTQKGSPQPPSKQDKPKSRGFRNTLRNLRDRLWTDHKTLSPAAPAIKRKHLNSSDLESFSVKELKSLRKALSQAIQDLSSDLVGRLQIRDQLRTEQDAMLLEVQDLTSL